MRALGEKSPIWVAITVRTAGGHGAYTHTSKSATKIAGALVAALEEVTAAPVRAPDNLVAMFRDPGIAAQVDEGCGVGHASFISKPTLNIGRMTGGLKMNVLPSECRIEADVRLPVGMTRNEMRPIIAEIVSRFPEAIAEELLRPMTSPTGRIQTGR